MPLEFATLLRLLEPVEGSWKDLGCFLLKDDLQRKLETIESDAFHSNSAKALDKVFSEWMKSAKRQELTWQALSDTATKYGDESLVQYIRVNVLDCELKVIIL